ncbi:MAG: hypothetical protein IPG50_09960 [Myxococcales bacterium]|nr:hypothetical protein [Myxococcales bacterium]
MFSRFGSCSHTLDAAAAVERSDDKMTGAAEYNVAVPVQPCGASRAFSISITCCFSFVRCGIDACADVEVPHGASP